MTRKHIYLDHGASTPVHPQVMAAMLPYWTEMYGNPASAHDYGRQANSHITGHAWTTLHNSPYYETDENWRNFIVMFTWPEASEQ